MPARALLPTLDEAPRPPEWVLHRGPVVVRILQDVCLFSFTSSEKMFVENQPVDETDTCWNVCRKVFARVCVSVREEVRFPWKLST